MTNRNIRWSRETCIAAIKDFYATHGRPPRYEDLTRQNDLPCVDTVYRHLGVHCLDDLYEIILGTRPISDVVEQFILEKSENGTKRVFYLTSREIHNKYGTDIRKLGAFMRKANTPGKLVAGYQLTAISRSEGKRRTFKCTRPDRHTFK